MEVYDVTVPVRAGMAVYDGDPPVRLTRHAAMAGGALANVSRLDFGVHTGTHVDAPAHFIEGGAGVDALPLDALVGPAWVVDATTLDQDIDVLALQGLDLPAGAERVLFHTRSSELWELPEYSSEFIGLTAEAARALVQRGVRLVGADYLSIAPVTDPAPTHLEFLRAGVVILEGLDLRGVPAGPYQLICLPLLIEGADGAPARALLVSD
jgi:arylformamidase